MAKRVAKSAADPAPALLPRVVIYHGKEAFLRQERTRLLRAKLEKQHGAIDVVNYDGATSQAADVLDECRSFGLLAGHKLVIVDSAEQLVKEATRPAFERYVESLAGAGDAGAAGLLGGGASESGTTLVLRASTWHAGRLDKLVEQVGEVIKCEEPRFEDAVAWVGKRAASEHRVTFEPEAATVLVERVGTSLARLDSEIGKLAAASGGEPITAQLVGYFVGASREESVWGIQATLLSHRPQDALGHVRYVLDVSREPPTLVLYAMTDLARKVHAAARVLTQGGTPQSLYKPLKLWPQSAGPILDAARRTNPARALELYRQAVRADQRSKSGLGEAERSIEMLALEFTKA